jgi:hypothetical protein
MEWLVRGIAFAVSMFVAGFVVGCSVAGAAFMMGAATMPVPPARMVRKKLRRLMGLFFNDEAQIYVNSP